MIIDGLIVGGTVAIGALTIWGTFLLLRRDDAPPVDADVHVNRLKYGNTWRRQHIQAQLITLAKLIEIADQQAPWPPAQPPADPGHEAWGPRGPSASYEEWAAEGRVPLPHTSPAAPLPPTSTGGADECPGTTAAAAGDRPESPPPLPSCAYTTREPFTNWEDDAYVTARASYYQPLDGA